MGWEELRARLSFELRLAFAFVGTGVVLALVGAAAGAFSGSTSSTVRGWIVSNAARAPAFVSVLSGLAAPPTAPPPGVTSPEARLVLTKVIVGNLDPKSVVASGTGLFVVQNMMYLHSINVYDNDLVLRKIISDSVDLASLGYRRFPGTYRGAPVEAAFTPDGRHVYVSNYSMYGAKPFDREGSDTCTLEDRDPDSFVYRIDVASLTIDQAIEVGAVPKFVAVTPDGKLLLVSNWCSYSESVVDIATGKELRQIPVGAFPRGIAVDPSSTIAYVAVMGSRHIAVIDLRDSSVSWIEDVGAAPRHLAVSPNGRWLYATVNGEDDVVKIDLKSRTVVARAATGSAPRSMAMAPDGGSLYVVNYRSNTVSKVRTSDMAILQVVQTNDAPIGITYDAPTHRVVVACYSGSIMVFADRGVNVGIPQPGR